MEQQIVYQRLERTLEEGARSVTIACVSQVTNEEGGIVVTPQTTLDDIMSSYARQFPREASAYLTKCKEINASLHTDSGMSPGGRMMRLTSIPEFVLWATRAIRRDYWDSKETIYAFIRRYPAFMLGDHTRKAT